VNKYGVFTGRPLAAVTSALVSSEQGDGLTGPGAGAPATAEADSQPSNSKAETATNPELRLIVGSHPASLRAG
jgi:hypothetical protein